METLKLQTYVAQDGILRLAIPVALHHQHVEVVVVLQALAAEQQDAMGYPSDFFAQLDAIEADDVMNRPAQGALETRDPIP